MNNNRNITLDILRLIACIGVILIHRPLPGEAGAFIKAISRGGVAFFFVVSGYYTYQTDKERRLRIIFSRITKLVKLLFIALAFYFVWEFSLRFIGSGVESALLWVKYDVFSLETWYYALIWDYDPLAGHLWFLFALIRCYLLVFMLLKIFEEKNYYVISCLIWIIIMYMEYKAVHLCFYRNGWMYGISFFLEGYYLSSISGKIKHVISDKISFLVIVIIVGMVLTVIEYTYYGEQQIYIGTIIICTGMFLFALEKKSKNFSLELCIAKLGKKYTAVIYIIHWAVIEVFVKIDKECLFTKMLWYQWINPVLVIILSISGSVFLCEAWTKILNIYKLNAHNV